MSIRKKLLDQKLVTEFAEFRALKNKIEKWLDALRDDFLEKFDGGFVCPSDGPYLLELQSETRSAINWKQEFFARLTNDFTEAGSAADVAETLAITKMAEMERLAGTKEIRKIAVKTNPGYAGKLMKAIVRKLDSRSARGF